MRPGINMDLDYDPKKLARKLLSENILLVTKLVQNNVVSNSKEANSAVIELLKFLYLCAYSDATLTPSLRIDAVWHELILFSRSYTDFCIKHFSCYIHHQPSDSPSAEAHQYQHTLQLYIRYFGKPNADFWVNAGICESECGSCENF